MRQMGKSSAVFTIGLSVVMACGGTDGGAQSEATTSGGSTILNSGTSTGGKVSQAGGAVGTTSSSSAGKSSSGGDASMGGTLATTATSQGGSSSTATAALGGSATSTAITANPDDGKLFLSRKLDLLLMIDNSISMGDKQAVLAKAVPQLLRRLTNPDCVSTDGTQRQTLVGGPTAACPTAMKREFNAVNDIHIGVVTSSLGDFGGNVCPEAGESSDQAFPDQNDHGWLLGALPRVSATSAYLTWTPQDGSNFEAAIGPKTTEFRDFVAKVNEIGCGIEMSLEAWYRFLIDPNPPTDVGMQAQQMVTRGPVDPQILAQRAAFLRPDSLVAVVVVTDENDCSLKDTGAYSWLLTTAGAPGPWRGSAACATDPNSPCCYSCLNDRTQQQVVPASCPADAGCTYDGPNGKMQSSDPSAPNYDTIGLRCFDQKRRFGFDFLFPVTRYSNALSERTLCPDQTYGDLDCNCTEAKARGVACIAGLPVANPLYSNLSGAPVTGVPRGNASGVFFATITGVPWQDLATAPSVSGGPATPLKYKTATELNWDLFAPPRDNSRAPLDPLMVQSVTPRSGVHPITGEPLAGPDASRNANRINGHEWNTGGTELQFACVFDLEPSGTDASVRNCVEPEYCANATYPTECARAFQSCSCRTAGDATYTANSPVCQGVEGSYSTLQSRAKAYPGLRQLQALRAFHESNTLSPNNAIAASLCPKDLTLGHEDLAGYGYNPAVDALLTQISPHVIP